ncbi:hypothetical protein CERSUDRAFT_111130 [Gelatoporia subvermispora B]|uniref:DASH complex subunit SPC19 n=1 Tax=Ceriporiopsis subvermispora (strain B) TaxID=914234 RepID=M2QTZ3_CERS8|nr:hypothetical protein CERSUDRAFT_111130 [Gelatoporia subvermispora B]
MDSRTSRSSRLSVYPRLGPRESIFASNPDTYRGDAHSVCSPFLRECVLAMEDCFDAAHDAQEVLRQGTTDLPRMTQVLQNERVFLLVDEGTVRRYKADLTEEIEPQINELISRAQKGLQILVKKRGMLHAKVDALESKPPPRATVNTTGMSKVEARRVQMLARERERLEKELAALQAEVDDLELASMGN